MEMPHLCFRHLETPHSTLTIDPWLFQHSSADQERRVHAFSGNIIGSLLGWASIGSPVDYHHGLTIGIQVPQLVGFAANVGTPWLWTPLQGANVTIHSDSSATEPISMAWGDWEMICGSRSRPPRCGPADEAVGSSAAVNI